MLSGEPHRPGRQYARFSCGFHGGKTIPAQHGEAGTANSGGRRSGNSFPGAHIEIQLVAYHETTTACGLYIGPVPVPDGFGNGDERVMGGTAPMKSIAAETYNRLTLSGFLNILRIFLWLK